jgi:glutamate-1-semialdehyde 2,1-aminomutase
LEPEKEQEPKDNFLHELQRLCNKNGTVFILDEMITGFRWHNGGAQRYHNVIPDLCTFGKAMANGFSVAALAGKKDLMELGGLKHDKERVFLMSGTHSAENHGLAAAIETMNIYEKEPVVDTLWSQGEQLASGLRKSIDENKLTDYIPIMGRPCCLVYGSRDNDKKPSQPFRTLLIQEIMKRGILAPSLVVSYSHTDADIVRTIEAFHEAFHVYRKAIDEGIEKYLVGRPVKPVWRKFN